MANHKKFIAFLMIFSIFMMPFNANASGLDGWTINNKIAQGASTLLNASKNVIINGANIAKTSTAKITPAATNVAKILRGGAAGYALSIAVEQLLGSVDWVLDPANNQIVYKVPPTDPNSPQNQYYWESVYANLTRASTMQDAAKKMVTETCRVNNYVNCSTPYDFVREADDRYAFKYDTYYTATGAKTVRTQKANRKVNPLYNPSAEQEKKTLPLDTVAEKVISNAETETDSDKKAGAQVATVGAAEDMLANDAATQNNVRNQLETNARTQTSEEAQAETKPKDPTAPEAGSDIAIKFPVFCTWAPTLCEAAQKVITFPNTLVNWWDTSTKSITESWVWVKEQYESITESTTDFFKEEPTTNTELEFSDPTNITDTSISFSNQCPAPITLADFNYHGTQQKWQMDFLPWCDVLSTFVKPIVIAMASLTAVLIVSGVRENG